MVQDLGGVAEGVFGGEFAARAPAEVGEDRAHVRACEQFRKLVDSPGNALIEVWAGDAVEQFA